MESAGRDGRGQPGATAGPGRTPAPTPDRPYPVRVPGGRRPPPVRAVQLGPCPGRLRPVCGEPPPRGLLVRRRPDPPHLPPPATSLATVRAIRAVGSSTARRAET